MSDLGEFRGTFDSFVDLDLADAYESKRLREGDTLILNAAHNADYVGSKTYRVQRPAVGALATGEWLVIRPAESRLEPGYAFHWVNSTEARRAIRDMVKGIHLYPKDVARLRIPLPPLPEQRQIAEILDKADALRAKRRAALAQLDTLTRSIFLDMFGDPIRNEMSWRTAKVSELCELVRGSSPRPQGDPRFFGGPVPRLMVADITRDGWLVTPRIDSLTIEGAKRSRPVPAGTVVMAVSGNVGLVSQLAIDACVHDGFVAFTTLDELKCQPGFLLALLHFSKTLHEKHKAGAIFINLTTNDIKAMSLPLPPIELQREYSRRMSALEHLQALHRSSLAELDATFTSIQFRAFRGELASEKRCGNAA